MKILSFDSSCLSVSVAIFEDDILICDFFLNIGLFHSTTMAVMINDAFKKSRINCNDVNLIASTIGPGSFTGIRIAISILKGIFLANDNLNMSCIGISSLEALAIASSNTNFKTCPIIEANNNEVYASIFKHESNNLIRLCKDKVFNKLELVTNLIRNKEKVLFIGDADCIKKIFKDHNYNDDDFLFYNDFIKASNVGKIAYLKYLQKNVKYSADEITPNYLKIPKAQRDKLINLG